MNTVCMSHDGLLHSQERVTSNLGLQALRSMLMSVLQTYISIQALVHVAQESSIIRLMLRVSNMENLCSVRAGHLASRSTIASNMGAACNSNVC